VHTHQTERSKSGTAPTSVRIPARRILASVVTALIAATWHNDHAGTPHVRALGAESVDVCETAW
jgi:hypothetical protein